MKVTAYFQSETGRYDENLKRFTNRQLSPIQEREISTVLEISEYNSKPVIRFIGGPTGYESYYLSDLIQLLAEPDSDKPWAICGGTINSWSRCWLTITEMKKIINHFKKEAGL